MLQQSCKVVSLGERYVIASLVYVGLGLILLSIAPSEKLVFAGTGCGGEASCEEGEKCCNGSCIPSSSTCCNDNIVCSDGEKCCDVVGCIDNSYTCCTGNECCDGGHACPPDTECIGNGQCKALAPANDDPPDWL